ncbi:MAG TPA: DUF434 domain-containing protein [Planctomycetota bacterium]|nr:DUF434 domain-containing protein [Planctomycetota bacterium]
MPDRRSHRSAAPRDERLFSPEAVPLLARATAHLSWLLSRGYADRSALKLVGDRFDLTARQREAVGRSACPDGALHSRRARCVPIAALRGAELAVDAYNVLTTLESALGGGVVLRGRDGCYRDLASLRGTWRRVAETVPALELVGAFFASVGVADCLWYIDRPVSNSRRLERMIVELARRHGWGWSAELVADADQAIGASARVAASADRAVLDACANWCNLAAEVIVHAVGGAWVVDMAGGAGGLEAP